MKNIEPNLLDLIKVWCDSKSIQYVSDRFGFIIEGVPFLIDAIDNEITTMVTSSWNLEDRQFTISTWAEDGEIDFIDASAGEQFVIGFSKLDCRDPDFFNDLEKIITRNKNKRI